MEVSFNNKWYPALIIFSLIAGIYVQTLNLLFDFSYVPLVHLMLSLAFIFSLFYSYHSARITIKVWAFLGIIGEGLGLSSIILLFFIDRLEGGFDLKEVMRHSIHLVIGCLIFFFWRESVKPNDNISHEA